MSAHDLAPYAVEAEVWEILQTVVDPELGQSLVDLGMIHSVTVVQGRAHRRCARYQARSAGPPVLRDAGRQRHAADQRRL